MIGINFIGCCGWNLIVRQWEIFVVIISRKLMPFKSSSEEIMLLSSCHDHKCNFLLFSLCGNNEVMGFLFLKWYNMVVSGYVRSMTKKYIPPIIRMWKLSRRCGSHLSGKWSMVVILFCKHTITSQNLCCERVTQHMSLPTGFERSNYINHC